MQRTTAAGIRRRILAWGVLVPLACLSLSAMDRWAALSQIESGDRDAAVGAAGEVSRYQIKPELWRRYAAAEASPEEPEDALAVAQAIMKERVADFERSFHRPPTDLEFYILWNAPALIRQPGRVVRERAERFRNLVEIPPVGESPSPVGE